MNEPRPASTDVEDDASHAGRSAARSTSVARRRVWPRFTLRFLLVATAVVAIALAYVANEVRESSVQRRIMNRFHKHRYAADAGESHLPDWFVKVAPASWTRWLSRVENATVGDALPVELARQVQDLRQLRDVCFANSPAEVFAGFSFERLGVLENLGFVCEPRGPSRTLSSPHRPALPADLTSLPKTGRFLTLSIQNYSVSDDQFAAIGEVKSLTGLHLNSCELPAGWLERMPVMPELTHITVGDTRLTLRDAEWLARQPKLKSIASSRHDFPADVREALRRLAPRLLVSHASRIVP